MPVSTKLQTVATDVESPGCYHCGEPVPPRSHYVLAIGGEQRSMCCPGCHAVAALIAGSGLEDFYQHRTAFSQRPDLSESESATHYSAYDDPEINESFSEIDKQGLTHARLFLGGITCAACTWLIEQALAPLSGIERADVSLGQSRLDVSFDSAHISMGEIFQRVENLGYKARPFQASAAREQLAADYKIMLRRLAVAGLGMMQVGMFAIALHAGDIQGIENEYRDLLRWVSLMVTSFVVIYSARPFFEAAWRHLRAGTLIMDLPVAIAIGTAWLASVWATLTGQGQVYFDSVVMFTFFLLLGRFLERRIRQRDELAWFDAESTLPAIVRVWREQQWQRIARRKIEPGERILIAEGELVPADAVVILGTSAINESTFNGEQLPRPVGSGSTIYAGTLNMDSALQATVEGSYVDTRLAALQRSVELSQLEKPALARLADQLASRFVAMVLTIAIATAAAWLFIDPSRALWITLSVLVISCPCALALATPAALTTAANGLRRAGIIVRGENAIEALSRSSHLIFDKTGTLTEGQLQRNDVRPLSGRASEAILAIAASLQAFSRHPVATAFSDIPANMEFQQVEYRVGAGVEGQLNGRKYRLGNRDFCAELNADFPVPPDADNYWIGLCTDDEALAWFGLSDSPREEAAEVIASATRQGLQVELLTGDRSQQGPALARALGIQTVNCGLSPQQKMSYVQQLQRRGALVIMVGDGLNDAPVLGVADASFAVSGATELARTQADFILVESDLNAVMYTWSTAKLCHRIIKQNMGWALAYNLCGIPLAAMGYIPPWMAAIGMSASSLLVVLNSLRLNRHRPTP